mmetsp:Transcript_38324/g.50277  ORF Transcript_38324/g.50277 Transcript_38324/m.50277 type:complete len:175 (-) Transcript_38324:1750-2274(-)
MLANLEFLDWLESQENILERFAAMLMMTLPGDRLSYYETSDVAKMREKVQDVTNEINDALGFYPVIAHTQLLTLMVQSNFAILFIGLVFNILIILFVVISVLLIYSLLMITTETKTFDIGVMRLVGLSSYGFIAMIFTQAVMFVIPSIIFAYVCSFPALYMIFYVFFDNDFVKG